METLLMRISLVTFDWQDMIEYIYTHANMYTIVFTKG